MNSNDPRGQTIRLAKTKPNVKRRIINTMTFQDMLDPTPSSNGGYTRDRSNRPNKAGGRG